MVIHNLLYYIKMHCTCSERIIVVEGKVTQREDSLWWYQCSKMFIKGVFEVRIVLSEDM